MARSVAYSVRGLFWLLSILPKGRSSQCVCAAFPLINIAVSGSRGSFCSALSLSMLSKGWSLQCVFLLLFSFLVLLSLGAKGVSAVVLVPKGLVPTVNVCTAFKCCYFWEPRVLLQCSFVWILGAPCLRDVITPHGNLWSREVHFCLDKGSTWEFTRLFRAVLDSS